MKENKFFLGLSLSLIISATSIAQGQRTEEIKVWGNCGMCEATIEKAAKSAGATEADWSPETKVLSVTYRSSKTSAEKIQQAIAATGYDTRDIKGSDEAYANLHGCCKYDRKPAAVQNQIAAMSAGHGHEASCCKDGKCSMGKDAACCKDGKCTMGHDGKSMMGKDASCCKDGKCTMGKDAACGKDGKCTMGKDASCCKDGKCTMGKDAACCKDGKCTMGKEAACCKA